MLTIDDILGPYGRNHRDITDDVLHAITRQLLPACWALEKRMRDAGIEFPINPATGTSVSGSGNGGFRPQDCRIGAPRSNHKLGLAVDRYDPTGAIDDWCFRNQHVLEECGIWLEHPDATPGWSHWQAIGPRSKARVFRP